MANLFFCGGLPKSGTTFLQKTLNLHPEVSCNSEENLEFLAQNFLDLHKKYNHSLSILASRTGEEKYKLVNEEVFVRNFYNLIKDIAINRNENLKFIGLSDNNFLLKNLINLSRVFINSKTILIFRNPIDTALSSWDHNHNLYKKEKNDKHLNIMKSNGELNINKYVLHCCETWNKQVKNLFEKIKIMPEKFLVITYEDLSINKYDVLKKMFNHIGCQNDEEIISQIIENTSLEKMRVTSSNPDFFNKGRIDFGKNDIDISTIKSAINSCKEVLSLTKIQTPY
tara:strand:+ start:268 stop:1116 length:849 start_codon:yes stop_codon:yes gene_type:complete